MAELAYACDSKSHFLTELWVQLPPRAPKRNLTAFDEPRCGTPEGRPTDFPAFFQTNSESRLRRDELFFRRGGGAKSEAILTDTEFALPEIQKEFFIHIFIKAEIAILGAQFNVNQTVPAWLFLLINY